MPYESDPQVLLWFSRALSDGRPMIRRRALELLEHVDCPARRRWLAEAENDADGRVAATAVIIAAILEHAPHAASFELMEIDFADVATEDLEWEWEYAIKICRGLWVPSSAVLAWTRSEDDEAAKRIAMLRLFPRRPDPEAIAIIVGKKFVNRYTRSPRNQAEATLWHHRGRPKYEGT